MTAIPEAKTMFSGSEIADVDGDGWKMFIDGWGNPIGFLRWAPGADRDSDLRRDSGHVVYDPSLDLGHRLVGHPDRRYRGHQPAS